MCNFFRRFIPHFADIAAPLNKLQRKNVPFIWTKECEASFNKLKSALITQPVLEYPDFIQGFTLHTDASQQGLGAVLMNKNGHAVAYASRSLNSAEQRYPVIHLELLALVWATKLFRPYLVGKRFLIKSDHRPLKFLFSFPGDSNRLTKYRFSLQEFDFDVEYIKGSANSVADALNRLPNITQTEGKISSEELKCMWIAVQTRQQTRRMNDNDDSKQKLRPNDGGLDQPSIVELLRPPDDVAELRFTPCCSLKEPPLQIGCCIYCPKHNIIVVSMREKGDFKDTGIKRNENDENDVMAKKNIVALSDSTLASIRTDLNSICQHLKFDKIILLKDTLRLIDENEALAREKIKKLIPKKDNETKKFRILLIRNARKIDNVKYQEILLKEAHYLPTGGHIGINRMYNTLRLRYYWPNMKKQITTLVNSCPVCQKCKSQAMPPCPLEITTTASTAFDKIFIDLYGPLPETENHNKYLLTVQCELSKFLDAIPLPDKSAKTVGKSLVENFFLKYGICKTIVSDQGTEFMNETLKNICQLLKINKLHSTAYHHETLGALENSHKPLGAYLRSFMNESNREWDIWCRYFVFCYNNTVHTATKYTPFELVYGRLSNVPTSVSGLDVATPVYNLDDFAQELRYRLQWAQASAKQNLEKSKQVYKRNYDSGHKVAERDFKPQDFVLLRKEENSKLEPLYEGPFRIVSVNPPNIEIQKGRKKIIVHCNRLKLFRD